MKSSRNLITIATFVLFSLLICIIISTANSPSDEKNLSRIHFVVTSIGGMVALYSAVLLLFRAANGEKISQLLPLVLPLLAGIAIVNSSMATVIVLGVIIVAMYVRQMVGSPTERQGKGL